ncbi:hypothetical protein HN371_13010 [Candidatus Poribacteria bacterium]|nr:hypothetical protein [Candidatus Poribacteria bacterium]MBT5535839.1 hypothetical protein [Candidatus Poribacteria bacterium]MBT5711179.1 hypothetical protein [Candidatus Poribacteria bacterium]MBT7097483.1 hypothetical protein [Candidatus Poribacteria bacterium]MBT7806559.1 hypothetical protein [Candidatus Poribacteria bacterium]
MIWFYAGKTLELIGLASLGVGLLIGIGNHTNFAAPVGPMSPERAMWIELFCFLAGMAVFAVGRRLERRA